MIEDIKGDFYILGRKDLNVGKFVYADLRKEKEIRVPSDVDTVIHLAGCTKALKKEDYYEINVKGTVNLLKRSIEKGVRKFVFISSQAAAGPGIKTEDDDCEPVSLYGKSKLLAEKEILKYKDKINILIVRPSAVFGPYDTDFLKTFKLVKNGIIPLIKNSEFSYVYVKDLVKYIIELVKKDFESGEIFFASSGYPVSQKFFLKEVANIMGKKVKFFKVPVMLAYSLAFINEIKSKMVRQPDIFSVDKVREIVAGDWICKNEKLKKNINYRETDLKIALKETIDWYEKNDWL